MGRGLVGLVVEGTGYLWVGLILSVYYSCLLFVLGSVVPYSS